MNWLIILAVSFLSLIAASFLLKVIYPGSQPGASSVSAVLFEDERGKTSAVMLLAPEYDKKDGELFQSEHQSVNELVERESLEYENQQLEAASQTLREAIEIYEAVRNEVDSAVVELNIALMAHARVALERDAGPRIMRFWKDYIEEALTEAEKLLKDKNRYEVEVESFYRMLRRYNS